MMFGVYSGILGLILVKISWDTINARRENKVSLGTGGNAQVEAFSSAHSNFISYVPVFLILAYNLSTNIHFSKVVFNILCIVFIIGRVLHYLSFTRGKMDFRNRVRGMKMTLMPIVVSSIANIGLVIYESFML